MRPHKVYILLISATIKLMIYSSISLVEILKALVISNLHSKNKSKSVHKYNTIQCFATPAYRVSPCYCFSKLLSVKARLSYLGIMAYFGLSLVEKTRLQRSNLLLLYLGNGSGRARSTILLYLFILMLTFR